MWLVHYSEGFTMRFMISLLVAIFVSLWSGGVQADATLSDVVIDYSTSGDHTLISGVASKQIRVFRLFYFCNNPVSVTISDSTPTTLIPVMNILQSQGVSFGMSETPYIVSGVGKGIVFNMSASQQCSGRAWYRVD